MGAMEIVIDTIATHKVAQVPGAALTSEDRVAAAVSLHTSTMDVVGASIAHTGDNSQWSATTEGSTNTEITSPTETMDIIGPTSRDTTSRIMMVRVATSPVGTTVLVNTRTGIMAVALTVTRTITLPRGAAIVRSDSARLLGATMIDRILRTSTAAGPSHRAAGPHDATRGRWSK
jgi:hypothetical protein